MVVCGAHKNFIPKATEHLPLTLEPLLLPSLQECGTHISTDAAVASVTVAAGIRLPERYVDGDDKALPTAIAAGPRCLRGTQETAFTPCSRHC